MTDHKIVGRVRGLYSNTSAENREDEQFQLSSSGEQIQIQGLPPLAELVRLGDSWQMMGVASTGLTAVPTTAGLLTLWNGEPDHGRAYVIDSVAATKVIIDVTSNDQFTIWAQIIKYPMAAPADAAYTISSLSGRSKYGGRARSVASSTTLANQWHNIGSTDGYAPAIAGSAWEQMDIPLLGRYIILPGCAFTLTATEITATASTFRFTIRWHEIQLIRIN